MTSGRLRYLLGRLKSNMYLFGKSTIEIHVTQKDIDKGLQEDAINCPVARALCRTMCLPHAAVGKLSISIPGWFDTRKNFHTPTSVREFVEAFDEDRTAVRPFSFELELQEKYYAN